MIRIAQVCPQYHPNVGGIATHVREISELLVKLGFDVEVVTTDISGKLPLHEIINGVKVTRVGAYAPDNSYFFSPAIYFYLKRHDYDVIHAHDFHSFPSFFAALGRKKRFIFTPHSSGFQKSFYKRILYMLYRPFGSYIFKSADRIISIAGKEKETLMKVFDIPENKILDIPLPIVLSKSSKTDKSYDRSFSRIGFFGRLSPEKNLKCLIFAFKLVKKVCANCGLYIAGDGPLRHELESFGNTVEDIHFVGTLFKPELDYFIDDLDVFVLPSYFEVSPKAVIEAMARGVPVIATPVGELPRVFQHGKNCLFTKIDDPNEMADRIIQLMNDKKLAKEIGLAGKALVENRYDMDKIIRRYIQIYTVTD